MKKLTFAQMSNKSIQVYSKSLPFYVIYKKSVRPCLTPNDLKLQIEISLSRPTIIIKEDEQLLVTNNFELFTKLKKIEEDKLDHRTLFYDQLALNDYSINQGFYELVDCILRHTKSILDSDKYRISEIYNQLNENLSTEDCQNLFKVNTFSTVRYCDLIGISESTFHRSKGF